ncbi:sugar transferase [Falsiroseomonas sp. E2-1-a4]
MNELVMKHTGLMVFSRQSSPSTSFLPRQKRADMSRQFPRRKRAFDLVVGLGMLIWLLPFLLVLGLGLLIMEGRPVLYVSRRRVGPGPALPIAKFRTMRRDADRIANRETIPVATTRFLNLPSSSPLYTPMGRLIERAMLTEMPQLAHVLLGHLSLIGNRPLPENVVASLLEVFPHAERRFALPCGLTGPVQLVGRDSLSDAERLELEIAYCEAVTHFYSVELDLRILAYTVLGGLWSRYRMTPGEVLAMIRGYAAGGEKAQQPRPEMGSSVGQERAP